jgi:hypothetical protein
VGPKSQSGCCNEKITPTTAIKTPFFICKNILPQKTDRTKTKIKIYRFNKELAAAQAVFHTSSMVCIDRIITT